MQAGSISNSIETSSAQVSRVDAGGEGLDNRREMHMRAYDLRRLVLKRCYLNGRVRPPINMNYSHIGGCPIGWGPFFSIPPPTSCRDFFFRIQ